MRERNFQLQKLTTNGIQLQKLTSSWAQDGSQKWPREAGDVYSEVGQELGRSLAKTAQDRTKTAQDRAKTGQDRPKTAQDRTKTAQDRPKTGPKKGPKMWRQCAVSQKSYLGQAKAGPRQDQEAQRTGTTAQSLHEKAQRTSTTAQSLHGGQNGYKMGTRWGQNGYKMGTRWGQDGIKMGSRWDQDGIRQFKKIRP